MLTAASAAVGGATCKGGGGPVGFGFRPPPPPTQLWTLEPMLDVSGEASLGTRPPPEDAAAADESISMLTMEWIVNLKTSTNLYGSLSRDYVSKLLRNEAAQTQNPYVILIH